MLDFRSFVHRIRVVTPTVSPIAEAAAPEQEADDLFEKPKKKKSAPVVIERNDVPFTSVSEIPQNATVVLEIEIPVEMYRVLGDIDYRARANASNIWHVR